jgi:hypothetical protein
MSSLSFAFEDPDGTLATSLLTNKTLYAFGTVAMVKKWKQRPPSKKPTTPPSEANTHETAPHPENQATTNTRSTRKPPVQHQGASPKSREDLSLLAYHNAMLPHGDEGLHLRLLLIRGQYSKHSYPIVRSYIGFCTQGGPKWILKKKKKKKHK